MLTNVETLPTISQPGKRIYARSFPSVRVASACVGDALLNYQHKVL